MSSASDATTADASTMCRRGTTNTCVGACGLMSRNATDRSDSATMSAGMAPATILQNRQSETGSLEASLTSRARCPQWLLRSGMVVVPLRGAFQLGIEVVETAGRNPAGLDETLHILRFETNHATELVGRQGSFVDEAVQAAQSHAEVLSGLFRAHPVNLLVHLASDKRAAQPPTTLTLPR
jgi:hypothetical protein